MTKKLIGLGASLALAVSLAACAEEPVPTPAPEPAPATPEAVVNADQLGAILDAVRETLAEADAAADPDQLEPRVVGPAAELREAEYTLAEISDGEETVTPLTTSAQIEIVAATDTWPRVVNVVTEVPEDANLPLLLTLVQEDPRSPYQLWSWVRVLPGTEMPTTVSAAVGSPTVAEDSSDVLVPPNEVIAQYVDLLNEGDDSDFAENFADDAFRTSVIEEVENLDDAVSEAGSASMDARVDEDAAIQVLGTHEGGAILVGTFRNEIEVARTVARSTLNVSGNLRYGGDQAVRGTLTADHLATVAFYIPPAGSDEQIRLLGAEYVLTGVERDDSTSPG